MGLNYLWDTNIAIYYLQSQLPKNVEKFIDEVLKEAPPAFSSITEIELLCWKTKSEIDLSILKDFVEDALIFELGNDIKLKTIQIRKSTTIKLPDAIIAATAIVSDLTLITRNTKDFSKIADLRFVDPFLI